MLQVVMELRFILIAAALRAVASQYCPTNTVQASCSSVLVIYWSPYSEYGTSLRDALRAMGDFTTVDDFNAAYGTPDASLLASYDAVVIYGAQDLLDPDGLGDRLAAYHDQGGGVVVAGLANNAGYSVRGAWRDPRNGYALLDYAACHWDNSAGSLGKILEPESPLLTGVSSFVAAPWGDKTVASSVINGGVVVAEWGSGSPLVVRGVRGNRTLVEITFYAAYLASGWGWTGDGVAMVYNALKFSRCIASRPGSYVLAGEENHSPWMARHWSDSCVLPVKQIDWKRFDNLS
jgi:hypothetical protein